MQLDHCYIALGIENNNRDTALSILQPIFNNYPKSYTINHPHITIDFLGTVESQKASQRLNILGIGLSNNHKNYFNNLSVGSVKYIENKSTGRKTFYIEITGQELLFQYCKQQGCSINLLHLTIGSNKYIGHNDANTICQAINKNFDRKNYVDKIFINTKQLFLRNEDTFSKENQLVDVYNI